jgi:hypothetical protein
MIAVIKTITRLANTVLLPLHGATSKTKMHQESGDYCCLPEGEAA